MACCGHLRGTGKHNRYLHEYSVGIVNTTVNESVDLYMRVDRVLVNGGFEMGSKYVIANAPKRIQSGKYFLLAHANQFAIYNASPDAHALPVDTYVFHANSDSVEY